LKIAIFAQCYLIVDPSEERPAIST